MSVPKRLFSGDARAPHGSRILVNLLMVGLILGLLRNVGTAADPDSEVGVSVSSGDNKKPQVAAGPNGGVAVAWEYKSDDVIHLRLFDASMTALTGEILVSDFSGEHKEPDIASTLSGAITIVWEEKDGHDIWARQFTSSGVAVSAAFQVSESTEENKKPEVAIAGDGSFIVTWEEKIGSGNSNVLARRFDAAGLALGPEFEVDQQNDENKECDVAASSDGSFVVTWENKSEKAIYARMFNSSGIAEGDEFVVHTGGDSKKPKIGVTSDGGFVVGWEYKTEKAAYARRYDGDGAALGAAFEVAPSLSGEQKSIAISVFTTGAFAIAWEDKDAEHVYMKRFNASGVAVTTALQVDIESEDPKEPAILLRANSAASVIWKDGKPKNIIGRIYESTRTKIVSWQEVRPH